MAEGGLFSGLKFTDIFFPAAAAAASAYNPYIGQGLNTGMNLFNSMAGFQGDVKRFAQQKREWDQLQEDREKAFGAAGGYASFVDDQVSERREVARKEAIAQIDGDTQFGTYGAEGPAIAATQEPESPEDMKMRFSEMTAAAPGGFDIFGGTQLPGPSMEDQLAEVAAPRSSEAMPWMVDRMVDESLAGDLDYKALLERQATTNMMGGTMGLAPGSSIATLGNLSQGATSGAQERARMIQVSKDLEMQRENQFIRDNFSRDERHKQALELQDTIAAKKEENLSNYKNAMQAISGSGDPTTMKFSELLMEARRMDAVVADLQDYFNPEDPLSVEAMERASARAASVQRLLETHPEYGGVAPAGRSDSTITDPDALKKATEAQARIKAITGG